MSFEKGFKFDYQTDRLDFADIQNLADLRYLGALGVSGSTEGDGHRGTITAKISSPSFYFEEYGLGAISLNLHYENDVVQFNNITGQQGALTYNGAVRVRVADSDKGPQKMGVEAAHLDIPNLDLAGLQTVFAKKVQLPFDVTGHGSASVEASGPFDLSKLNYKIQSFIKKGSVGPEEFSEGHFNIHGDHGHAYTDQVSLKKGDGVFNMTGDIQPSGNANLTLSVKQLRLSDLTMIRSFTNALEGRVQSNITLQGPILKPRLSVEGKITNTSLNQEALEDSDFVFSSNDQRLKLDGQVFNNKIGAHLVYPLKEHQPFEFQLETHHWDFSSLLGFLGKQSVRRDYETALTAKINLVSKEGGFWNSTGEMVVNDFLIRRTQSVLRNRQPIVVKFDDGMVTVESMRIDGNNTQFNVSGFKNKKDQLNFNVNGRLDLSLFAFLTPFFRDMNGELSLSTQIAGSLEKPDLLGSAFIKNGFFKLEALPQPFENVSTDFVFSQSKIIVNRISGKLGGGTLSASGSIGFNSFGNIPIELTGDLLRTNLTLPEGINTRGDFHYAITGNWFPYLLKGDYVIDDGLFSREFASDSPDNTLKRSSLLPLAVLQKNFSPLEVDINANFTKGLTVRNQLMDGDVKGSIEIKGDPDHAILLGNLTSAPGTKVFFRETPFTVTDMKIGFNNPTDINPELYLLASSRVRDWDITLLVQGTASKPRLQLTSSPALSEKSIVSLLALGVTDEDELKTQQTSTIPNNPAALAGNKNVGTDTSSQSYAAGGVLLSDNPLQNEIKRRYGVNVRLSQTFDDVHNIIEPQVVAEKQWTPKISTSVSRTLGDLVTSDVNVEYKLNRYFSVLGTYESRDFDNLNLNTTAATQSNFTQDIFGINFQYQLEFK